MEEKKSVYETLAAINVNEHTEKKNGLTYLSWPWAWGIVKKHYPDAIYTIYEDASGKFYHDDGRTAWVKTGVTIGDIEHIEYLPVMDYNNRSISLDKLTSFHVNTAIQRSLTKAVARHGLGLYIYAGEDLPYGEEKPDSKDGITKDNMNNPITDMQRLTILKELKRTGIAQEVIESEKSKPIDQFTRLDADSIIRQLANRVSK